MSKGFSRSLYAGAAVAFSCGMLWAATAPAQESAKKKQQEGSAGQSEAAHPPVDAVEWRESQGGNGHFYKVVAERQGITWIEANGRAIAAGGHLATITSAAENEFVAKLADAAHFWGHPPHWAVSRLGPWLGGRQGRSGKWQWVTGEPFKFTDWHENEPNTHVVPTESAQALLNCISFYAKQSESPSGRSPLWSDNPSGQDYVSSYVIEFDEFGPCGELKQHGNKKWEHLVLTQRSMDHVISQLKEAERQGWELVSVVYAPMPRSRRGLTAIFRRPERDAQKNTE